jgi:hypothetical protein
MVKTVLVTPAQVDAAKAVVRRRAETGRPVPEALRRIAEADADRSADGSELGEAPAAPTAS